MNAQSTGQNPTNRELLIHIKNLADKLEDLTTEVQTLNNSVLDIQLASAHKKGFEQAAGFWFKVGWVAAFTAITSGFLIMFGLATGKINITDFFK
jgi:hypothetical protein